MSNICLINPKGGDVSVIISANNTIRCAGFIYIGQPDANGKFSVIHKIKFKTGNSGTWPSVLPELASRLAKHYGLAWRFNACAMHGAVENGTVKVEVFQDGQKCRTTQNTTYRGKYRVCSEGGQKEIQNNLVFNPIPDVNMQTLWDDIS